MGNRKLPFGYTLQFGEIIPHPTEHICVQHIFNLYQSGASFSELVSQMVKSCIPYDEEKSWNKSMIARILSNEKYTGQSPYPSIITQKQFQIVSDLRKERQNNTASFQSQNLLRKLCGRKATAMIASQVHSLLDNLIQHPEYIQLPAEKASEPTSHQKAWKEALTQPIEDDEVYRGLIQDLISSEYSSISSAAFETAEIRRILMTAATTGELQEALLKKCVRQILVTPNAPIQLILKNGQIIDRRMFT